MSYGFPRRLFWRLFALHSIFVDHRRQQCSARGCSVPDFHQSQQATDIQWLLVMLNSVDSQKMLQALMLMPIETKNTNILNLTKNHIGLRVGWQARAKWKILAVADNKLAFMATSFLLEIFLAFRSRRKQKIATLDDYKKFRKKIINNVNSRKGFIEEMAKLKPANYF